MGVGFDAILLFCLTVPMVMTYRILPVEGTPYWLFGVLFFTLISYFLLAFISFPISAKKVVWLKNILFWLAVGISLGGPAITAIVDRSRTAPAYGAHDIILQLESAMRFMVEGKNPYKEIYTNTPMAQFHYTEGGKDAVNPGLFHFVMPPWYLMAPFPFYFLSIHTLGYFDGRMPLLFCMLGLLVILYNWVRDKQIAKCMVLLVGLCPATVAYFIEGRSDFFALFWLALALFLLAKKRFFWSTIVLGLAFASKQTTWFAAPFYAMYLWLLLGKNYKRTFFYMLVSGAIFILLCLPFMLWDARAFIDSVILYLSGGTAHAYPISGYGIASVLLDAHIIRDIHSNYPFFLWQAVFALPTLGLLLWLLKKQPRMSIVWIGYGIFLTTIWYFSRYFNNSHVGYVANILTIGGLLALDERGSHEAHK